MFFQSQSCLCNPALQTRTAGNRLLSGTGTRDRQVAGVWGRGLQATVPRTSKAVRKVTTALCTHPPRGPQTGLLQPAGKAGWRLSGILENEFVFQNLPAAPVAN